MSPATMAVLRYAVSAGVPVALSTIDYPGHGSVLSLSVSDEGGTLAWRSPVTRTPRDLRTAILRAAELVGATIYEGGTDG